MRVESADMLSDAMMQLRSAGLHILSGQLADWVVRLPDGRPLHLEVKAFKRAPSLRAWDTHTTKGVRLLFVVQTSSAPLKQAALHGDVDLVELDDELVVIEGRVLRGKRDTQDSPSRPRPAWVRWGVMRTLYLLDTPAQQEELALYAGTTQATVSQTLRLLNGVERDGDGWTANDKETLLATWRNEYRGTKGVSTYWYGLDPPLVQARDVLSLAGELEVRCLLTGDAAADIIAPWRIPQSSHVYVSEVLDLTVLKLTPAPREQSTITVTVPQDPTVWHTASVEKRYPECVDSLIAYWDLMQSKGSDADEAAGVLLRAIRRPRNA